MINTTTVDPALFPTVIFDLTRYFSTELYQIIVLIIFCGIGIAISFLLFKTKSVAAIGIVCAIILVAMVAFDVLSEIYGIIGFVIFALILTLMFMSKRSETI